MMVLGLKPSHYHVFTNRVFIECLKYDTIKETTASKVPAPREGMSSLVTFMSLAADPGSTSHIPSSLSLPRTKAGLPSVEATRWLRW